MTCWHFCLGGGLGAVLHYLNKLFLYIFHKSEIAACQSTAVLHVCLLPVLGTKPS